jgi:hypothetical protein
LSGIVEALGARNAGWPMTNTNDPPGRSTRRTAATVASRSAMSMSPSWQVTVSTDSSLTVANVCASSFRYVMPNGSSAS